MKKSTKGALAISAAAILLLGGGGTLAYWSDNAVIEGGAITHGTLAIDPVSCDEDWVHDDDPNDGLPPVTGEAVDLVVPGDAITKQCTFTIEATGDHLEAALTVPDTITWDDATEATTFTADVTAAFDVDGTAIANGGLITDANDGQTLTATITVDIPYGDADTLDPATGAVVTPATENGNDTQGLISTLDTLAVSLAQTDH